MLIDAIGVTKRSEVVIGVFTAIIGLDGFQSGAVV